MLGTNERSAGPLLLFGLLLGPLLGLVACGRTPEEVAAAGPAGLLQNLWRAKRLEIVAAEGPLAASAARATSGLVADGRFEVRHAKVVLDASDRRAVRTVLATVDTPGIAHILDSLGVSVIPEDARGDAGNGAGFAYDGEQYVHPGDALVATLEDPERSGLPLTLFLGNDAGRLAGYVEDLTPAWRPNLRVYRAGILNLELGLDRSGWPLPGTRVEHGRELSARIAGYASVIPHTPEGVRVEGLDLRAPAEVDPVRIVRYSQRLHDVRERVSAHLPGSGPDSQPGARPILVLHPHAEDVLLAAPDAGLFDHNPVAGMVNVLLSPDLPDDAGAGAALALVHGSLGPPAQSWLRDGAAFGFADAFWGVPLDRWVAFLRSGDLVPEAASLVAKDAERVTSPFALQPARGFLLRWLLERGEQGLDALWSEGLEVTPELEADFARALDALVVRYETELEVRSAVRSEFASRVPFWEGVVLTEEPGIEGAGFGTRAADRSLQDVVALGANAVSFASYRTMRVGLPEVARVLRGAGMHAGGGDLALAASLGRARALDLATVLRPTLLASPSGSYAGRLQWGDEDRWDAFFDDYARFLVHHGLLGELFGCDALCIGSSLAETSQVLDEAWPEVNEWIQAGWPRVIRRARDAFRGSFAYAATWPAELKRVEIFEHVDLVAIDLFHPVVDKDEPGAIPDATRMIARMQVALIETCELAEALGKPAYVSAVGFTSTRRAWADPSLANGPADMDMQRELYEGLAQAVERALPDHPSLRGLFVWRWSTHPQSGGALDRGFTPQNKAAADVLRRLYTK